jgi:chorismate lyase / 3-hydroxybenzoate synthase
VLPLWCELTAPGRIDSTDGVLATIAFGDPVDGALATIALPPLAEPLAEVWRTNDSVTPGTSGEIAFAKTEHVLLGTLGRDATDVEWVGEWAFDTMIEFARTSGYPHLLRIWNHVGGINEVENGMERYRSFCAGRYESFARHGYALRTDLPAASAVGMRGRRYQAYFVASKAPGVQIENPREVSAYDYPPQYGRRSPSFSRATVLRGDDESLVFVAGTASIVGHETKHHGDACKQTDETIRNIARVLEAAGMTLGDLVTCKAYVRHAEDFAAVQSHLRAALGETKVLYLLADICRADLLVEVEGVARKHLSS